ncbi:MULTISPECIES: hypothetical protein [Enterobacter]|uniref:hypothetical protein n=1 Tax=Enterobacter TaxID=547 RepID=UPI0022363540|nr:hypothetical protein [Enterobacter mori]MCW4985690.1 hypothetical protein [Enterobacter mori]
MNEQELLEAIRSYGRCDVVYLPDGSYVAVPVPAGAVLILPIAHEENAAYFRDIDS